MDDGGIGTYNGEGVALSSSRVGECSALGAHRRADAASDRAGSRAEDVWGELRGHCCDRVWSLCGWQWLEGRGNVGGLDICEVAGEGARVITNPLS